jgi:hypothetical protein
MFWKLGQGVKGLLCKQVQTPFPPKPTIKKPTQKNKKQKNKPCLIDFKETWEKSIQIFNKM